MGEEQRDELETKPPFQSNGAWYCVVDHKLHGPWDNRGGAVAGYQTELRRAGFHQPYLGHPPVKRPDYQRRVVEEQDALLDKLRKLEIFLMSDQFKALEEEDQWLLKLQHHHMFQYMDTLRKRIYRFDLEATK